MNTTITGSRSFRPIPAATILPGRSCDAPRAVVPIEARMPWSLGRMDPGNSGQADRVGQIVWFVFWMGSWSALVGCACQLLGW